MDLSSGSGITFRLSDEFVSGYADQKPPFGFNGLGELVYLRTYSRMKPDGEKEKWYETVKRVVEGTYSIQKRHILSMKLPWDKKKAEKSAEEMFHRMFNMKFLPPGRGLWAMGSPAVEERGIAACLNNCGFVSTNSMDKDPSLPFVFMMDALMLGVGIGFDTLGCGKTTIRKPKTNGGFNQFTISDSREGWVESVKELLDTYFVEDKPMVYFDYSKIRKAGEPIKGFGGEASGPDCLAEMHREICRIMEYHLHGEQSELVSEVLIVDLMNIIGKGVIAGNVRRSAILSLGSPDSEDYLDLKNYEVNPHRESFGWTSNNSVLAKVGQSYKDIAKRIQLNGEPGIFWVDNVREYGRMGEPKDYKDMKVVGTNPCAEQSLESFELCCLVETFPAKHETKEDYLRTLKFAYLYAKTVTLCKTHWPETNKILLRNRRIGCSMSGIAQFLAKRNTHEFIDWCENGYKTIKNWDTVYSDWFAVPRSIKISSIKPSGTVSLLAGATPGVHFPESRFYIRRVRLSSSSKLLPNLKDAGYYVEDAAHDKNTVVVEIPVDSGEGVRPLREVSMWEQLSLAALVQKCWADNQVSVTVTYDREKEGKDIEEALNFFQYQLKSVSFLPRLRGGAFPQMPYEEITEDKYNFMTSSLIPINFNGNKEEAVEEKYCTTDVCELKSELSQASV